MVYASEDSDDERVSGTSRVDESAAIGELEILRNDDADTMRILLSTDNHLGYAERDNIRGMDSFAAFEEVLYLAKRFHCDLVLIAGDLFHDNRPSRRTLHKTMEILRRHCMGPGAVRVQIMSDTANIFRSTIAGLVNYHDPNYSIDMPIFSIHGNHDDPSRDQGGGELLAALDLLAINNLVNYFGRQDEVDQISISPVLLKKGETKVALYGLGNLRDERLNRIWERQKVAFLRPDDECDDDDEADDDTEYFNIFMLHQNRDLGRGTKNCVHESMIPEWMDIVVWGHEHECLIEFFESVVGTFRITQPGSSVATSLISGEAAMKKVGILDINGKNFRLHPVPLTQVRSFVTTEISLREHRANLDPEDPKIDAKVAKVLEEEVRVLMLHAREKANDVLRDARSAGSDTGDKDCPIKYKLQEPEQVLVRIRVEHAGFSTVNNQRFGAKFVGEVANPSDILLFHRKKDPKLASTVKTKQIQPIAPEELESTNMEDLVREQLAVPEGKLRIFGEKELSEALEDYVDKSLNAAISDVATEMLDKTQKTLIKKKDGGDAIEKESAVVDMLEREEPQSGRESAAEKMVTANDQSRKRNTSTRTVQPAVQEETLDDDYSDEAESVQQPPTKQRSNVSTTRVSKAGSTEVAGAKKRVPAKRKAYSTFEESDSDDEVESIEEDDDDFEDDNPRQSKKPARAAPKSRAKPKAAPAKKTAANGSARRRTATNKPAQQFHSDSDDDTNNVGESAHLGLDWGSAATKTQRGDWR